jgi:hypothetical protein
MEKIMSLICVALLGGEVTLCLFAYSIIWDKYTCENWNPKLAIFFKVIVTILFSMIILGMYAILTITFIDILHGKVITGHCHC